jgi:hypothetical protein
LTHTSLKTKREEKKNEKRGKSQKTIFTSERGKEDKQTDENSLRDNREEEK